MPSLALCLRMCITRYPILCLCLCSDTFKRLIQTRVQELQLGVDFEMRGPLCKLILCIHDITRLLSRGWNSRLVPFVWPLLVSVPILWQISFTGLNPENLQQRCAPCITTRGSFTTRSDFFLRLTTPGSTLLFCAHAAVITFLPC